MLRLMTTARVFTFGIFFVLTAANANEYTTESDGNVKLIDDTTITSCLIDKVINYDEHNLELHFEGY